MLCADSFSVTHDCFEGSLVKVISCQSIASGRTDVLGLAPSVLVIRDQLGAHAYEMNQEFYTLGRSKHATIHLMGSTVSRIHAAIYHVQGDDGCAHFLLVDGHPESKQPSTNGSYINGNRISEQYLQSCDKLAFGTDVTGLFFTAAANLVNHPDFVVECRLNRALRDWAVTHNIQVMVSSPTPSPGGATAETVLVNPFGAEVEETTAAFVPPLNYQQQQAAAPASGPAIALEQVDTDHLLEPTYAKIGQILVRKALITQAQLEQALEQQASSNIPLGQYFVASGLLSAEDLDCAVRNQRMRIGEILARRELITVDQLRYALQLQHQNPNKRLGEVLIEQGMISLEELEAAIQEQHWRRNGFWFLND